MSGKPSPACVHREVKQTVVKTGDDRAEDKWHCTQCGHEFVPMKRMDELNRRRAELSFLLREQGRMVQTQRRELEASRHDLTELKDMYGTLVLKLRQLSEAEAPLRTVPASEDGR